MKQTIILSAALCGLMFTACHKSSNSTPPQPSVGFQLMASNANYTMARTTATANVQWTSGTAWPDVVKFEAKQDNLSVEYKSTNNAPIDLMASSAITFGDFVLPSGMYKEIEVKIDLDKNGTNPVMQLDGHFTSGLVTTPIELLVTQSLELQTEQHDVSITNDSSFTALTTIDLSSVAAGITANMLLNAHLTTGTVIISASSNSDLYDIIVGNLKNEHHHCEFKHHHH